jgi:hypothetical protein
MSYVVFSGMIPGGATDLAFRAQQDKMKAMEEQQRQAVLRGQQLQLDAIRAERQAVKDRPLLEALEEARVKDKMLQQELDGVTNDLSQMGLLKQGEAHGAGEGGGNDNPPPPYNVGAYGLPDEVAAASGGRRVVVPTAPKYPNWNANDTDSSDVSRDVL